MGIMDGLCMRKARTVGELRPTWRETAKNGKAPAQAKKCGTCCWGAGGATPDQNFIYVHLNLFAFHAYPGMIHRLTYRRANHGNIHVRGFKEEGAIPTPFDMTR
jgi:hypothetical protein